MPTIKESFEMMPLRFQPDKAAGTHAVVQYNISGAGGGVWHAVIKDGTCAMNAGPAPKPTLLLETTARDWMTVVTGAQSGQALFMAGRLKLKGDMGLAMNLGSMFAK